MMYSITNEEPEPMTALRTGVPMELELLVNKCLAKEADRRYQGTADMVVDLETLSEKLKSGKSAILRTGARVGTGSPVGPSHPADAEVSDVRERHVAPPVHLRPGLTRERVAWAAATVLLALAAITLAAVHFNHPAPQLETTRFFVYPPDGVYFGGRVAEISPDGRHLAFVGISDADEQRLWVRSLDSLEARPLAGTEGAELPFWSPDNRFIGFFAEGKLKKISVDGGHAQTLSEATGARGGTWAQGSSGSDGLVVFAPRVSSALLRISDAGGEPAPATILDESAQETTHRLPHFLPDGRHFLYLGGGAGVGTGLRQIYIGSLDPGTGGESESVTKTPLLPDDTPVRYEPVGQPFPIAEGISALTGGVRPSDFSVSQTGVLAYRTRAGLLRHQLAWFGRDGKRLNLVGERGAHAAVSLSPDKAKAAISRFDSSRDIWIHDLARDVPSRFTFHRATDLSHTWSPDGRRLAFSSDRDGSFNLYLKPTSGAGESELLFQTDNNNAPRDWSRDGRLILFADQNPETGWDLWVLPLEGEKKPVPYLQTEFAEVMGQFSPDGRWVAYASNESGRSEIYVQPYPADGGKWQVSTDGGIQPRWRADGKELFYLTADDRVMAAEIEAGETFQPGVPHMLFSRSPRQLSVAGNPVSLRRV